MIPEKDRGIAVQSTVTGEGVKMELDDNALTHIMGLLTDAYSDRELAVIREYATNAIDAHAKAGVDRPIEVSTPTDLRPVFQVRDYGPGLSREDIRTIYSRYGASTKRGTNAAVGMLGIGCKSALALVDQFSLVGVKDGVRVAVSVSRAEDGTGSMTILEEGPSDEPSGVTVQIPVRKDNQLAEKAAKFFRFWKPGTVLLNGEQPEPIDGYRLTDDLLVRDISGVLQYRSYADDNEGEPRTWIVMGNVPYPASLEVGLPRSRRQLVARVPIGSVDFPPSREALKDTPRTRATLESVRAEFKRAKNDAIQRDLDAAKTRSEAVAALVAAEDALAITHDAPTWRGEAIPRAIPRALRQAGGGAGDSRFLTVSPIRTGARNQHGKALVLGMPTAGRAVWITDWDNANWTATTRAKLMRYMAVVEADDEAEQRTYVVTRAPSIPEGKTWLRHVTRISWKNDVRPWRDPDGAQNAGGGGVKYAGTYPTWTPDGFWKRHPASDLDPSKPLFYARDGNASAAEHLRDAFPEAQLVEVTSTREAKFLRLFPTARPASDGISEAGQKWLDSLTDDQRHALARFSDPYRTNHGILLKLDETRVDDPTLSREIRQAKLVTPELRHAHARHRYSVTEPSTEPSTDPLAAYPLVETGISYRRFDAATADHVYLYVNAVFAANRKGNT